MVQLAAQAGSSQTWVRVRVRARVRVRVRVRARVRVRVRVRARVRLLTDGPCDRTFEWGRRGGGVWCVCVRGCFVESIFVVWPSTRACRL